jgi:hypothetical protein
MKKYQMASTMRNMKRPLPPSRTAPQFVIRFPDEKMRDRYADIAKSEHRSMNSLIIHALQSYLDDIDREEWENSPERLKELNEDMQVQIPPMIATPSPKPLSNDQVKMAIETASEKAAEKALERMVLVFRSVDLPEDTPLHSYMKRVVQMFSDLDANGNPINHSKSRTPKIPGVNIPKRGSKK